MTAMTFTYGYMTGLRTTSGTRCWAVLGFVIATWLVAAPSLFAQMRDGSSIEGTVTDATGAVLQEATLVVSGPALLGGGRSAMDAPGVDRITDGLRLADWHIEMVDDNVLLRGRVQ